MAHDIERELPCPYIAEDGEDCDGTVLVKLEWNPGENYGADADGNRGMWIPGYYSWYDVGQCEHKHELTSEQERALGEEAEELANDAANDEYYEPDYED